MKVLVVGAGYAGTLAANRLVKKVKGAEVTVVNPRAEFVERVRLHQRVAGSAEAARPLRSMLRDGIEVRVGEVEKVSEGTLVLAGGGTLPYDHLFLAVGSTARPLPGTVPVGTWEGAGQARAALAALPAGAHVTVVGGGATGVETATEVAEQRPDLRVRLVGERIADMLSGKARARALAALGRLRVDLVEDVVTGAGAAEGEVRLRSGGSLPADLVLWAVVSGVPPLAADSGLDVDAAGRAVVDPYLRSVSDGRILAVGDCAAVPGARFGCQTAGPQAAHAVDVLARLVAGREPKPYPLRYVGRCVSLGRADAVMQFTHLDDSLRTAHLGGRTGARAKELIVRAAAFGSRKGFSG
ncbi:MULTISPECIES: NAD(P)/FAD-dependent oxidoreductase [unclassified Streptomyces]|uniref:NAD(P)/FAD-dependent oxidoreductase n=1 Tax=unclassified Streptomyces TaxID=2593676 RepID=UPI00081F6ADE|nr:MULTISPECIES: FAD-dependent oxidoreductase [unclassified Streptomyces]MYR28878.1 FAD-dependent oxidoreductase [Streptomyces sp. SID4945]NJA61152.1 FAD-dependent oxidoreductase [Streptomyces sp. NEAU-H3]SCF42081.1 NADH dehydrogenase, FAD-containing subunit [Streptomyces sp. LcepLS]